MDKQEALLHLKTTMIRVEELGDEDITGIFIYLTNKTQECDIFTDSIEEDIEVAGAEVK